MPLKLAPKQRRFVEEYLLDLNATQASIRAGYSAHTAQQQGPRLLGNVGVLAAIAHAMSERAKRAQIDSDWVLKRLSDEANADIATLYDKSGNLLPVGDWPMVFRTGLVVSIETVQERAGEEVSAVRKVKLSERIRHIELIGKHVDVAAFRERMEVADVTDRAEQMRKRRESRHARRPG